MLTIPENVQTLELAGSTVWFDELGILCSKTKKLQSQTVEQTKVNMAQLRAYIGGAEKVCMLVDVTHAGETTLEIRTYAAEELPKIAKAIAMVSQSALGKMIANLFFCLKSPAYPVRMFNTEKEAKDWLKNHL